MSGARFWPAKLPERIRRDRYRQAEVRVYDELAATLGAGWTVFYSRPWLGITPSGAERDGEADFVIVHPQHGFLTLEVKGGEISYDPTYNVWQSKDRDGIRHNIRNPFEQAKRAKYGLLKKLGEQRDWSPNRTMRMRHGVVFPDAAAPPRDLGADMPRDLICCRPGLSRIHEWVEARLSGGNDPPLGKDGVALCERLLAYPFRLRVPLGHLLEDDDRTIGLLTPEQFHILEAISANRRIAVGGGAGTGKTVLAAEDALRHAAAGRRSLLTCLSEPLADSLRSRLADTPVTVLTFDQLCRQARKAEGLADLPFSTQADPEVLLDAASNGRMPRFDVIVVDEAQDFRSEWWVALEALFSDAADSKLHAFYDSNQSVYGKIDSELAGFALLPIHLSRNLRNTRAIHQAASQFYKGLSLRSDGPEGVSVDWTVCEEAAVNQEICRSVRRLVEKESVSPSDIVVLSPSSGSLLKIRAELGNLKNKVISDTVMRFKGLESSVVLLAATRDIADLTELAYVGLSRPRTHLIVIGTTEVVVWLRGIPGNSP